MNVSKARRCWIPPLVSFVSIASVATAGIAASRTAAVAADYWPADGLQVMSMNGPAVFLLPGGSDRIRVLGQSALCADAPPLTTINSGLAEGDVTADGQLLAGNGQETLLFCTRLPIGVVPPSPVDWFDPVTDGEGYVYAVGRSIGLHGYYTLAIEGTGFGERYKSVGQGGGWAGLVFNGGNRVFSAWTAGTYDTVRLELQAFGAGGEAWPSFQVNANPARHVIPALDTDGQGNAVIAWWEERYGPPVDSTYVQSYDVDGHPRWGASVVLPHRPSGVRADGAGGVYVLLANAAADAAWVTRLDADGGVHVGWPSSGVPILASGCSPYVPAYVADGHGGLVILARCAADDSSRLVRVLPSGEFANGWAEGVALHVGTPANGGIRLAADGYGGVFAVWSSDDGAGTHAYYQHVLASGAFDGDAARLTQALGDQQVTSVLSGQPGELFVGWRHTVVDSSYAFVGHRTFDVTTPTRVSLFDVEPAEFGVRVTWQLVVESVSVVLERAPEQAGPWSPVTATPRDAGGLTTVDDVAATPGAAYWYRLTVAPVGSSPFVYGPVWVVAGRATRFALSAARPNPSRGPLTLEFSLPRTERVRLSVVDLQGRKVAVLVDETRTPGRHRMEWDSGAGTGRIPEGVYFARCRTPEGALVTRFALVR